MPDRLSIYNGALLMTGSRRLASLTENVESRRVLDDIWDNQGRQRCLEKGLWNHAMRTVQADYSASVAPPFGFRRAFDKPTDIVRLVSLCEDEFFTKPLYRYQDEGEYWFADLDTIYVRYVSNDASYGLDMSMWPESFTEYVEGYFALKAIKRLTDAKTDADDLKEDVRKLLVHAKANDAQKDPVGFAPATSWQRARSYGSSGRYRNHPYR